MSDDIDHLLLTPALPDGEELELQLFAMNDEPDDDGTISLTEDAIALHARLLTTDDDDLTLTQLRAKNNVRIRQVNMMGVQLGGLDNSLHTELIEALVKHLAGQKAVDEVHRRHQDYIARQLTLNEPQIRAAYAQHQEQEEAVRRQDLLGIQTATNRQQRRHPQ